MEIDTMSIESIERYLKDRKKDNSKHIIQANLGGLYGISVLGKNHPENRGDGKTSIFIKGLYNGKLNKVCLGKSISALKEAIEIYEKEYMEE